MNGQWTATPATYQYGTTRSWMLSAEQALAQNLSVTPEMEINLAGMPPLRFGCRDVAGVSSLKGRFSWRGDVPQRVNDPAAFFW